MFTKFFLRLFFVFVFLFFIHNNHTKPAYAATAPCYGFVVFSHASGAIPSIQFLQQLNPGCVRMEYDAKFPYATWPKNIKNIVLFLWDQVPVTKPVNTASFATWKTYIDNNYIPALQNMLKTDIPLYAVEVWNEEDLCSTNYCPLMPTNAYAYMLKNAARVIKAYNPNIKVVMGGLASGNPQFIRDVKSADPTAFNQVDAIGFHPYGKSPDGWCVTGCPNNLPFGDLAQAVSDYQNAGGLPIWVTEIGQSSTDQQWQAQYLQRTFTVLTRVGVPVMTWYKFDDGGDGPWGLVDANHTILKPDGVLFRSFNTGPTPFLPLATPTLPITPTATPTISPTALTFTILLHGIGKGGDNINASSGGTLLPVHSQRPITLGIYDNTNQLVLQELGTMQYNAATGQFKGTVTENTVASGQYLVKITVPGFLQKQFPGIQAITPGTAITLPTISLITGDVNSDNHIDILDYNTLISCFGSKINTASCLNGAGADINDDGIVDGIDYNLFLRELSIQQGN
jgi:hypothetical protein